MSAAVLLKLGDFVFSMDTAAFEELQRTSIYSWPEQARIGTNPALQFTGVEAEVIILPGKIYPYFRGGLGQIDGMRAQAALGTPLLLVDGLGSVKGYWCITRVRETRKSLGIAGAPRCMEFELECRYYGPNGTDTAPQTFPVIAAPTTTDAQAQIVRAPTPAVSSNDTFTPSPTGAPFTPGRIGGAGPGGIEIDVSLGPVSIGIDL